VGKYEIVSEVPSHLGRPAVFLDRDGVLNEPIVVDQKPYPPRSVAEFRLLPGVVEGCRLLKDAGFLLVVATNQPDVGRGTLSQEVVEEIHRHLCELLPIDRVEVSYDAGRGEPAPMRKPAPGMLLRAAGDLGIDLAASYMIGDRWRDVDCGNAAGCRTVFIDYGYDEELRTRPHFTVHTFAEAAQAVLESRPVLSHLSIQ